MTPRLCDIVVPNLLTSTVVMQACCMLVVHHIWIAWSWVQLALFLIGPVLLAYSYVIRYIAPSLAKGRWVWLAILPTALATTVSVGACVSLVRPGSPWRIGCVDPNPPDGVEVVNLWVFGNWREHEIVMLVSQPVDYIQTLRVARPYVEVTPGMEGESGQWAYDEVHRPEFTQEIRRAPAVKKWFVSREGEWPSRQYFLGELEDPHLALIVCEVP